MIGLDTNILVRLVMKDDPKQLSQILTFLSAAKQESTLLFINNVVLCELVWVLLRGYKQSKNDVIAFLDDLIHTKEIRFSHKETLRDAINLYKEGKGDFADYLTFVHNKDEGCSMTYSLDMQLVKEKIFQTF